jgi:ribosome-associated protein
LIEGFDLAVTAREALIDKKGLDVVLMDVRELSSVTDYYVIATGTSAPHLKALFQHLQGILKEKGVSCFRKSGTPESEWLIADYVDLVVHLFSETTREYYGLEQLWSDARKVE